MSKRMLNTNQLKMFMTPSEIDAEYTPLDGDRRWKDEYDDGSNDPRAAENTDRPFRTDMVHNQLRQPHDGQTPSPRYQRPSEFWPMAKVSRETDDDLWNRKHEEAFTRPPEGGSYPVTEADRSLGASVVSEGIHSPIRLSTNSPSTVDGKQQILGGHHRLAVARQAAPDTLIPVVHDPDISTAKVNGTYKYT